MSPQVPTMGSHNGVVRVYTQSPIHWRLTGRFPQSPSRAKSQCFPGVLTRFPQSHKEPIKNPQSGNPKRWEKVPTLGGSLGPPNDVGTSQWGKSSGGGKGTGHAASC